MSARPGPYDQGFRLILSDSHVDGGQKFRSFTARPTTINQLTSLLEEAFGFEALCRRRGLDGNTLRLGNAGIQLVGLDGPRHVPLCNDEDLNSFFGSVRNSKLPSLEVKVHSLASADVDSFGAARGRGRDARDRVEELENVNFQMSRATNRVEKSLEEVERVRLQDKDETERLVNFARRDLASSQEEATRTLMREISKLQDQDAKILNDIEVIRRNLERVERTGDSRHAEVSAALDALNLRTQGQFEQMTAELDRQAEFDDKLQIEDTRLNELLVKHGEELVRLEREKVDQSIFKTQIGGNFQDTKAKYEDMCRKTERIEETIQKNLEKANHELKETACGLEKSIKDNRSEIDEEMVRMDSKFNVGLNEEGEKREAARADLIALINKEVESIDDRASSNSKDVSLKFTAQCRRTDELTAKCEATFIGLSERLDALVLQERARLGTIERDLAESTAKLRSDCRSEIERIVSSHEQETARLDLDLGDLHMKHDVTKQEINFFQSRLLEQRDWSQRQLAETATATRAAQVDAQEGLAAATKMLHALRDDQVGFRDKMAKHISILQHSTDSHADGINSLETQRVRMRHELDVLLDDHKAYVSDMDGWADDVRIKVERLFRAMEPPRAEWVIGRAEQRIKELKKPLAIKSPSFALQGLRECQIEFYPNGTNNSPMGKSVLRLCMPPYAYVRYQVWLGRATDGSREYKSDGTNLAVDLYMEDWSNQIHEDGTILITFEVLSDLNNNDESLARAVRIESL